VNSAQCGDTASADYGASISGLPEIDAFDAQVG
jgi:hypothetical protein